MAAFGQSEIVADPSPESAVCLMAQATIEASSFCRAKTWLLVALSLTCAALILAIALAPTVDDYVARRESDASREN